MTTPVAKKSPDFLGEDQEPDFIRPKDFVPSLDYQQMMLRALNLIVEWTDITQDQSTKGEDYQASS